MDNVNSVERTRGPKEWAKPVHLTSVTIDKSSWKMVRAKLVLFIPGVLRVAKNVCLMSVMIDRS